MRFATLRLAPVLILALLPTTGAARAAAPAINTERLYVANLDGPVTAYPAASTGAVSPVLSLADPKDPNTYWAPWSVAADAARNIYVQTFLSDATTFVFPSGASQPSRMFRLDGPDSPAIAVDSRGYEYVLSTETGNVISVGAPGASGVPANLYTVPPVRQIPTDDGFFHPWPGTLTTDTSGHVLAALARPEGNAIEVFTGGPTGGTAPVRVIAGPHTGLGTCASTCDQLALAYSPFTGRLYVAVSQGTQTHINVYPGTASGDAAPIRVISGSATRLAGQVITGIADSQVDGNIYVMAKADEFDGPGTVLVFDRLANGNVAPRRSFTDAATGFRSAMGIALTN